jgi:fibronectin-binding autotransporter adhesin
LELSGSTTSQWTNRRVRIGSNGTGSGSATILNNNNSDPAHTLTFTNSAFNVAATDTASFNRTLTLGGSNTGNNTISGAIINNIGGTGGRVAIQKSDSGTWVLNGANTYTGSTSISGGLLRARLTQTSSALSTGSVSVSAGATLLLDNQSTTNVANVPTLGNIFTGAGLLRLQFAAGTTARNTYLPNVSGFGGTIQLSNAGTTGDKWNTSNSGTVAASVVVDSGSSIFMSAGTNSFTGGITLNGPGNSENRGALRVGGASTVLNGEIRLAGHATLGMENAAARITGNITSAAAGDQVLTLGGTQGSQVGGILSGNIGTGTGTLHLTVANGSYTLTGANTYTGNTAVNQGTLALVGTSMASPISVATGARLGFTLGSPATSTSAVDLSNGSVRITGAVDNATSYTLITAVGGIAGTPVLDSPIPDYELRLRDGSTKLVLAYVGGGYATWAAEDAGGQGPDLDFDFDGVANGIEFFLKAAPGFTALPTLDASHKITWINGGNIPASEYGTQFVVQTSDELVGWTDVPVQQLTANTDGPDGVLTFTLTGPAPRFVRLKVTPQ